MRIDEYAEKRKYALKPSTLDKHVSALRTFEKVAECYGEPTLEHVNYFLDVFESVGLKTTTVSFYCSVIKQYFKLFNPELVPSLEQLFEIRKPRVSQADFRAVHLSKEDVRKILQRLNLPYNLIIAMMYCFCRRLGEVLALEKKDIARGTITFGIFKKKGVMRVTMPLSLMPLHWQEKLFDYIKFVEGDRVFPYTQRAVEIAFKVAALKAGKAAKPHDIRHARIRHLLDDGVDPFVVKDKFSFHEHMAMIWDIYGRLKPGYTVELPQAEI